MCRSVSTGSTLIRWSARRRLQQALLALLIGALSLAAASVQADSYDERRVRTGARLVRALLAADEALERKADAEGALRVQVYAGSAGGAEAIRQLIAPPGDGERTRVRGLSLRADLIDQLPPAGPSPIVVFLAVPLDDAQFAALLAWCIGNGVILYSPFEGDVERGATAGLSVQAKVQPFVNLTTLESSGIELRKFFLDHSRAWR